MDASKTEKVVSENEEGCTNLLFRRFGLLRPFPALCRSILVTVRQQGFFYSTERDVLIYGFEI